MFKKEYMNVISLTVQIMNLGFDYLRHNMVDNYEQKVQKSRNFAIVDEVDNILMKQEHH